MKDKKDLWLSSILAGLVPHTFCILFVLLSILGATTAMAFLKPFLLQKNFFYFLIILSFAFATLSALFYLAKNGILSWPGVKRKWQYLGLMYGLTILTNLALFLLIFPAMANFNRNPGPVLSIAVQTKEVVLQVEIPCSGHASLITNELKKNQGIESVVFALPNTFRLTYNAAVTSEEGILDQEIFQSFKATVLK